MTSEVRSYYQLLDVEPGTSQEEVRQAYRELVKVWHPDRFENDAKLRARAEEKLKEINIAYSEILNYLEERTESSDAGSDDVGENDPAPSENDERVECFRRGQALYAAKDFAEAARFISISAKLGYGNAQALYGEMYYKGHGVRQDINEAVIWWTKAGEQGHAMAQYCLGAVYNKGHGSSILAKAVRGAINWQVGDTKIEAFKWFNLSVTNGYARARGGMEDVSICLSQNQINEARSRASRFYPPYRDMPVRDIILDWFRLWSAELNRSPRHIKCYQVLVSDIRSHPGIENDIAKHIAQLLEDEFFGRKGKQVQSFFQDVGNNWKGVFGGSKSRGDCVRMPAAKMILDAWDAYSPEYICRKENILNHLWLKIFAGK